jgi:hypothetical protein
MPTHPFNDQVELSREVVIDGKFETVRVRFPMELVRFGTKEAEALIDADFAWAIQSFQRAS